jgi:hypothetical protein
MSTYRENAAPEPRRLDFRAVPLRSTVGKLWMSVLLFGYGACVGLGGKPAHPVAPENQVLGELLIAAAVLAGLIVAGKALAGWTTRLQMRMEGENLVIDWRRWGQLVRTQVLPRSSIESVFVRESPGRSTSYRLVIATSAGEMTFEGIGFGAREDYEKQVTELRSFLELGDAPNERLRIATDPADADAAVDEEPDEPSERVEARLRR